MMTQRICAFALVSLLGLALVVGFETGALAESTGTDNAAELKNITLGDKDATVRIDEYASLTCSHCARFHNSVLPKLKEQYINTGKVKLVMHSYPLNKPALEASMLVQCMPDKRRYNFMSLLFENQKKWAGQEDYKQALKQNARLAGMSNDRADKCFNNQELRKAIVSSMQQASKELDISSTPTFILNDGAARVVGAQSIDVFADKIDKLIDKAGTMDNGKD
jgi:protein-disulfide isomerase